MPKPSFNFKQPVKPAAKEEVAETDVQETEVPEEVEVPEIEEQETETQTEETEMTEEVNEKNEEATAEVTAEVKEKKPVKKRIKPAADMMTSEDVEFIVKNYTVLSIKEISEQRGITTNQVNRVVSQVRTELRKKAEGDESMLEAVEKEIDEKFTRESVAGKRGKNQGPVKNAIDKIVADIFDGIKG